MDQEKAVTDAIAYIHSNYRKYVTVADIAEAVCVSPSYFAVVFRAVTGYSVSNYLSQYRLYQVAKKLVSTNEKVIILAYENGFSSQQALTRSFSQQYGMGPAQFRKTRPQFDKFPPDSGLTERGLTMRKAKVDMEKIFEKVNFVKKDKFFVVGLETELNYNLKNGTQGIEKLYERWEFIDQIPDQVNHHITYGMTYETTDEDTAKYMVGVEVSTLENIPALGVVGKCFDACEYAVFECTLEDETSGRFFQYFFSTFLKKYQLEMPESSTTKKGITYSKYPVIEMYDDSFRDESSKIKIYVPIFRPENR